MQDFEASILAAADAMVGASPDQPAEPPAPVEAPPAEMPVETPAETPAVPPEAPPAEQAAPADKLAVLAKQEQEQRAEKFRQERLQFLKEREELEKTRAELSKFRDKSSLKEQALADPVSFIKELGLDPNDFATRTWKKQIGDDKDKTADQVYGVAAQLERVQRELAQLKEEAQQKEQAASQRQQAEEYKAQLASALTEVSESLPHVKPFLEKRKDQLLGELYALAVEKHQEDPDTPVSPTALFSELEKRIASAQQQRVKQLEEELEIWRSAGMKPTPVSQGTQNAKPTVSPTLSNSLAGATERKSAPQSEDERLAEAEAFVRSMWSGAASP